jgi:CRP-like cAMP-binding protein
VIIWIIVYMRKTGRFGKMGIADFLLNVKSFKELTGSDMDALNSVCAYETFTAGQVIFPEEGAGDKMYIIKTGSVKITKKVKEMENTIALLEPGEFFGEMALLDGMPRSAAAKAVNNTEVIMITRESYLSLRQKQPQTAFKIIDILIRVLSNRLRQANKNLEVISFWIG